MTASLPLLAAGTARTVWGWGRIESNADLVVPLVVVAALCVLARWMIRLDTRELSPRVGWLLTALRVGTILCLLVIYLQPEWRSEREMVRNSRVLLLVDTSSSMGLADVESPSAAGAGRLEHVAQTLGETDFLDRLRRAHDVVVLRFDEELKRVVSLDKHVPETPGDDRPADGSGSSARSEPSKASESNASPDDRANVGDVSSKSVLEKAGSDRIHAVRERARVADLAERPDESGHYKPSQTRSIERSVANERRASNGSPAHKGPVPRRPIIGNAKINKTPTEPETPDDSATAAKSATVGAAGGPPQSTADGTIDWRETLSPTGVQTRLGQALRELVLEERGSPVAGIVVFTDGGQNAGVSPEVAIEAARTAKVPVFPVGLGSLGRAVNVRVAKLEVPPLAHPGDPYVATGLIQAQGLAGESATVELLVRESDEEGQAAEPGSGVPVRREEVILGADGEALPVKFELTPTETGRRTICLRVDAPEADSDPTDDYEEEEVEIVDRKIRVLLFAGGPTREYRFLRTQLYRDASITLDVLLQTGQPGISQEADRILDEFPAERAEMYVYDCVVALDPDWRVLTEGQVDLLEGWVAEQGGGLIVVSGPIHAGESIGGWIQDPSLGKIRALYPVEFQRQLTAFEGAAYASRDPWPLEFTREGLEAEFLRLGETATASRDVWDEFPGVYSCFAVRGPKPGAAVLARFSDPRFGQSDAERVYLAEQFYGSGRVFYEGSGEMWRLRRLDPGHFERFYTSVIRHVSGGRVLRQSSRGTLMVDRDRYVLGSTVQIRARLTDPQLEPLEAMRVPLNVIRPDGNVRSIALRPDPSRAGMFAGQLTVLGEGTYRLELPVPESDDERLTRRIKVTLPDLERQSPQRNDKLLSRIAQGTGGKYYPALEAAVGAGARDPLIAQLKDRTKTIIQTGVLEPPSLRWALRRWLPAGLERQAWLSRLADRSWLGALLDQTLIWWLMIVLCSLLCCEWLIRRLSKLA